MGHDSILDQANQQLSTLKALSLAEERQSSSAMWPMVAHAPLYVTLHQRYIQAALTKLNGL